MVDFSQAEQVWLASYPRSGNTLLRTILFQCFGLHSTSIYPEDLAGNAALEAYVGHLERDARGQVDWPDPASPHFVKTHEIGDYGGPMLYVVRDGRDAVRSLHRLYQGEVPLEELIKGKSRFGSWANHIAFFLGSRRPGSTLLVRYEDMLGDLPTVLEALSAALCRPPIRRILPSRDEIAAVDGLVVNAAAARPAPLTEAQLALFERFNGAMLRELGYA